MVSLQRIWMPGERHLSSRTQGQRPEPLAPWSQGTGPPPRPPLPRSPLLSLNGPEEAGRARGGAGVGMWPRKARAAREVAATTQEAQSRPLRPEGVVVEEEEEEEEAGQETGPGSDRLPSRARGSVWPRRQGAMWAAPSRRVPPLGVPALPTRRGSRAARRSGFHTRPLVPKRAADRPRDHAPPAPLPPTGTSRPCRFPRPGARG